MCVCVCVPCLLVCVVCVCVCECLHVSPSLFSCIKLLYLYLNIFYLVSHYVLAFLYIYKEKNVCVCVHV